MVEPEKLPTDTVAWNLGPFHAALPGAFELRLLLDGEQIVQAQTRAGFTAKPWMRNFSKTPWKHAIVLLNRIDTDSSLFFEYAYCTAVERLLKIEVSARAERVRLILMELSRMASHLRFMVRIAKATGLIPASHYCARDREKILDLLELATGARFCTHFFRIGGLASEVTEGFIDRALDVCNQLKLRVREYNDVLSFHPSFLVRTCLVGVLPSRLVEEFGISGPGARASGIASDLRRENSYSHYSQMDFTIPLGSGEYGVPGDLHDRYIVRLRELVQSIEIIEQACRNIPAGDAQVIDPRLPIRPPLGAASAWVESPRGAVVCDIASSGALEVGTVTWKVPSKAAFRAIPSLLEGARLEDLAPVLESLDFAMGEVDL